MSGSNSDRAIRIERNTAIPMRDGIILRADVYRPSTAGRYPVIVGRVGYKIRDWPMDFYTPTGKYYAQRGYVVVWQNVRGTFASQGQFDPFRDDAWGVHQSVLSSCPHAAAVCLFHPASRVPSAYSTTSQARGRMPSG